MMDLSKVDTLVFGGAGAAGVAYLSVLRKMIKDRHVDVAKIKSFAGTSSGSMIATFLCAGFSPDELLVMQEGMIGNGCFNVSVLTKAMNMFKGYGVKNFDKVHGYLNSVLLTPGEKRLNPNTTFRELQARTQKDLFITGTNVTKKRLEIFSHYTTPNMKIMDALFISMSASPVFKSIERNGDIYVDGACMLNYPINIFLEPSTVFEQPENRVDLHIDYKNVNNQHADNNLLFPEYKHNSTRNNSIKKKPEQILGFMLNGFRPSGITNFTDFFTSLFVILIKKESAMLRESAQQRTIQIKGESSTSVFEFSTEANAEFVLLGEKAYRDAS
jgi:predicted acylesterase/phospholipase RssA